MDRRQLEQFLAVVDEGSVTRAAHALHVAQPSISHTIRQLESELGGQLFERVGRTLILTAAGRTLVSPARQVLRDFTTAQDNVRDALRLAGGSLDIMSLPSVTARLVSEAVPEMVRAYPGVFITIASPRIPEEIPEVVANGAYDVGFTLGPVVAAGLVTRSLAPVETHVLLPPNSTPAGPISLAEIAELQVVVPPKPASRARELLEGALAAAGLPFPKVIVQVSPRERVIDLVLAGVGAAFVLEPIARNAARLGAVVRRIEPPLVQPTTVVYRDGPLPPTLRAFLKMPSLVR